MISLIPAFLDFFLIISLLSLAGMIPFAVIFGIFFSVLDVLTFYHCRHSKKKECAYISSQMMTVPELDVDNVDNFVYDELEVLRLKLEEKYDRKVELWTGVENVDMGSGNFQLQDQFMLLLSPKPFPNAFYPVNV